jgi:mono/diheme cytochrome c family protein
MSRCLCKAFQPAAVAVFGVLAALSMLAAPVYAQAHVDEHAAGRTVYTQWCAPCHAAGVTHPGTHALTVKYQGVKPGVLLEWRDLPANTVKFVVRHGISVMPQFRKTEINDQDLDALAKFLSRNSPAN